MDIVKLYETASSDGYSSSGDGLYFLDKTVAISVGKNKHGNYASGPLEHNGVKVSKDGYLLIQRIDPIVLADSEAHKEKIRQSALKKLSSEEKEILGIS